MKMTMLVGILILFVKNAVTLEETFDEEFGNVFQNETMEYDDWIGLDNETFYENYDGGLSFENGTYSFSNQLNVDQSDHVFAVYQEDTEKWSVSNFTKNNTVLHTMFQS